MGANYDMIITATCGNALESRVQAILREHGMSVKASGQVGFMYLQNESIVVVGPCVRGRQQVVLGRTALNVEKSQWFSRNPMAAGLSLGGDATLHIWSHDSGLAAGFGVYQDGVVVSRQGRLSEAASEEDLRLHQLQLPEAIRNPGRNPFVEVEEGFRRIQDPLEAGVAEIVSKLGFDVHLIDIQDVVDDAIGIAVEGGRYFQKSLKGWGVIEVGSSWSTAEWK